MNVAEKRKPQDGRLKTKTQEGNEVELRLSTLPTAFGEKMVMRIFDPDILLKSFEELGLANEDYDRWQGMVNNPNGIVLVTGPTGSGKTTTLYSSLRQLSTAEVNVCTIEDPIEMVEGSFNQMQVQQNIDLGFADGVRALLRQDPDIIMVGEVRDLETANMAIQAALTGHLVLSTLHTNDAPSAITRLLELGVAPYLIKATVGCLECRDTGYMGRAGVYELLTMSDSVKALVDGDVDIGQLRIRAMKEGMKTLRLSGAQKVSAGLTTVDEVLRVAPLSGME
jgi:general secretion pathway protein E